MLSNVDKFFQANCYYSCDFTISVASTCMVESIICNKHAISLEFGYWATGDKDVAMKDFKLHHLQRIYSYGSITRVGCLDEMVEELAKRKNKLNTPPPNREVMLRGEVPLNRGYASVSCANKIVELASAARGS